MNLKTSLIKGFNKTKFTVQKNQPEIMIFGGIGLLIGGAVVACKATIKGAEIMADYKQALVDCDDALQLGRQDYGVEQYELDLKNAKIQTGVQLLKTYAVPLIMGGLGVYSILTGHNILKKRNIALVAAYTALDELFNNYRGRVKQELGEDQDYHFLHGTKYKTITETTVDKDGNVQEVEKTIQVSDGVSPSGYHRVFCDPIDCPDGNPTSQWSRNDTEDVDYNIMHIKSTLDFYNNQLEVKEVVFLNEVYESLGFQPTQAGAVTGWSKDGRDGYISFGRMIDSLTNGLSSPVDYKKGDPIILDFNVDGPVWTKLKE